jgi:hypothetical protein
LFIIFLKSLLRGQDSSPHSSGTRRHRHSSKGDTSSPEASTDSPASSSRLKGSSSSHRTRRKDTERSESGSEDHFAAQTPPRSEHQSEFRSGASSVQSSQSGNTSVSPHFTVPVMPAAVGEKTTAVNLESSVPMIAGSSSIHDWLEVILHGNTTIPDLIYISISDLPSVVYPMNRTRSLCNYCLTMCILCNLKHQTKEQTLASPLSTTSWFRKNSIHYKT